MVRAKERMRMDKCAFEPKMQKVSQEDGITELLGILRDVAYRREDVRVEDELKGSGQGEYTEGTRTGGGVGWWWGAGVGVWCLGVGCGVALCGLGLSGGGRCGLVLFGVLLCGVIGSDVV